MTRGFPAEYRLSQGYPFGGWEGNRVPRYTDGQTERVNRVVEDILRSIAEPTEWSKQLPLVEFAINNSVHASTGETPFYLNGRTGEVQSPSVGTRTIHRVLGSRFVADRD